MTLQRKIMRANFWSVVLPVFVIILIWVIYAGLNSRQYFKVIGYAEGGGDGLTETINILYTYETEIAEMKWRKAYLEDGENSREILIPDESLIREMGGLGYHFQVECADKVTFTNLDQMDLILLSEIRGTAPEGVFWTDKGLLIRDIVQVEGQSVNVTAVYNGKRADQGVQRSQVPVYIIPRGMSMIFLVSAIICIACTAGVFSHWLGGAVLPPLQELKKSAEQVAKGNLDYSADYEGRDEFSEVFAAFEYMRLQLKEAEEKQEQYEEERKEMLRGISHDLRSPLTSIKGYAMGIKDGIANTREKIEKYCDAILIRTEDLERLTLSLSLLVSLESDSIPFNLEKVNVDEYIGQLLEEKKAWLEEQKVEVRYRTTAPGAEVRMDIRGMQRVFMNLFDNTVRYRISDRSKVGIYVRRNKDKVEIRFTDDGPGVNRKHVGHIFERFYRADESRTSPEKGSGIGLAVVRQIIEGEEGQVSASSKNGLCIKMTLPSAKET